MLIEYGTCLTCQLPKPCTHDHLQRCADVIYHCKQSEMQALGRIFCVSAFVPSIT